MPTEVEDDEVLTELIDPGTAGKDATSFAESIVGVTGALLCIPWEAASSHQRWYNNRLEAEGKIGDVPIRSAGWTTGETVLPD